MGTNYKTVLIAGVPLTRRDVDNGTRTRYDPVTGERREEPIIGSERVTESGVVYHDPINDMTDDEVDDWINPRAGDLCYTGGEANIHAVGIFIESHDPRDEPAPCDIDWQAIGGYVERAKAELLKLGINDRVQLMMLTDAH